MKKYIIEIKLKYQQNNDTLLKFTKKYYRNAKKYFWNIKIISLKLKKIYRVSNNIFYPIHNIFLWMLTIKNHRFINGNGCMMSFLRDSGQKEVQRYFQKKLSYSGQLFSSLGKIR